MNSVMNTPQGGPKNASKEEMAEWINKRARGRLNAWSVKGGMLMEKEVRGGKHSASRLRNPARTFFSMFIVAIGMGYIGWTALNGVRGPDVGAQTRDRKAAAEHKVQRFADLIQSRSRGAVGPKPVGKILAGLQPAKHALVFTGLGLAPTGEKVWKHERQWNGDLEVVQQGAKAHRRGHPRSKTVQHGEPRH
jgi:hypothetical protein